MGKKKVYLLKFRRCWSSWSQKAWTFSSAIRGCAQQHSSQLTPSGPSLTAVIAAVTGTAYTRSHLTSAAPGSCHCPSRASLLPPREMPLRTESIILKRPDPLKWEFSLHGATHGQPWESCNQLSGGFCKVPQSAPSGTAPVASDND